MIYDLKNDFDKKRLLTKIDFFCKRNATIEVVEKKKRRTLRQNNYLHVILGCFAIETGNTLEYVKTEYFKRFCNPELFVRVEFDELLHKKVERLRSSRDLDTGEMTTAIERFRNWAAAEAGIDLPSPDEAEWIGFIERDMQHQQIWI